MRRRLLCALDLEWTVCFGSGMDSCVLWIWNGLSSLDLVLTACALALDSTVFALDLDWDVVVSVLNFAALLFLNWLDLSVPRN